jgi:hypothetical protein
MKSSNPESRTPKQIRIPKFKTLARMARSVLECGSPLSALPLLNAPSHCNCGRGLPQSKTWRLLIALLCLITLHLSFGLQAFGQSYSIDWSTIDGGGGTSTGGVYSVSGTIGQPDAGGPMTGGNYSLTGGFWSLLSVVQTPDAPLLTITLTATNTAIISWPSPSSGFNLQQNGDLKTTNWVAPSETVADNGTIKYITVNPPVGNRFYRLARP